eukprot:7483372-Ditylum_brightwellii.AAC.1
MLFSAGAVLMFVYMFLALGVKMFAPGGSVRLAIDTYTKWLEKTSTAQAYWSCFPRCFVNLGKQMVAK